MYKTNTFRDQQCKCQHPDCGGLFVARGDKVYCSSACRLGHRAMLMGSRELRTKPRYGSSKVCGTNGDSVLIKPEEFNRALDKWLEKRGIAEPKIGMRESIKLSMTKHRKRKKRIESGDWCLDDE